MITDDNVRMTKINPWYKSEHCSAKLIFFLNYQNEITKSDEGSTYVLASTWNLIISWNFSFSSIRFTVVSFPWCNTISSFRPRIFSFKSNANAPKNSQNPMYVSRAQPKITIAQPADIVWMQTVIKYGTSSRQLYGNLNKNSELKNHLKW